jgi:uncharacterized protein
MLPQKKKTPRKKASKKNGSAFRSIVRLCSLLVLLLVLVFSVCTAGYVIFFRTVFAEEIPPSIKNGIVFEEPDPLVQVVPEEEKTVPKPELPKVAIIIDGMGYHETIGRQLLALPFELTYSFLHLPLQPKGRQWQAGPGTLTLEDSPEDQITKFEKCLHEVPHAAKVSNHMGSLYTEDPAAMTLLMQEISRRRLSFVDSYTSFGSVGLRIAREHDVKSGGRHVFLDDILTEEKIGWQLQQLVTLAKNRGVGIGIAHPHQETLDAISSCAEDHKTRVHYVSVKEVLYEDLIKTGVNPQHPISTRAAGRA